MGSHLRLGFQLSVRVPAETHCAGQLQLLKKLASKVWLHCSKCSDRPVLAPMLSAAAVAHAAHTQDAQPARLLQLLPDP